MSLTHAIVNKQKGMAQSDAAFGVAYLPLAPLVLFRHRVIASPGSANSLEETEKLIDSGCLIGATITSICVLLYLNNLLPVV